MAATTEEEEGPRYCAGCGTECTGAYSVTWISGVEDSETIRCDSCERGENLERYAEDRIITSRLTTEAVLFEFHPGRIKSPGYAALLGEINEAVKALQEFIRIFDTTVWLPQIPPDETCAAFHVRASKYKGMSAKIEGETFSLHKFMSWSCAGRTMLHLEDLSGQWISMLAAEDEDDHRMGLQGIRATYETATKLIVEAVNAWRSGRITLVDDKEVGLV